MFLAGVPLDAALVLELARLVNHQALAERLEAACRDDVRVLALTVAEREALLFALDDPPAGVEELRGVLLAEHVARKRDGLA